MLKSKQAAKLVALNRRTYQKLQNTSLNQQSKEKYGDKTYYSYKSRQTFEPSENPGTDFGASMMKEKQAKTNLSWNNLKRVRYRFQEEREISDLIGIDVQYDQAPYESGYGAGGGGQVKQRAMRNINNIGKTNK